MAGVAQLQLSARAVAGCGRRNLGGTPLRPGALLEVYAQVKGNARKRRVAVCKTVGLAYVGSNPTPATSVMSQDIEDTANLR